jgi:hypothetical protein
MWVEIKGTTRPDDATLSKCRKLAQLTKQRVFLFAGNIGDQLSWAWADDGVLLAKGQPDRKFPNEEWIKAIQAARSARCEHGESPEQQQCAQPRRWGRSGR